MMEKTIIQSAILSPGGDLMDRYSPAKLMALPLTVKGFVYHDDNGEDFIILNSRLSWEQNAATFEHEQDHILRGDLLNEDYDEYGGERT
jgi:hypothetical protein